jgi:hypothetical protein
VLLTAILSAGRFIKGVTYMHYTQFRDQLASVFINCLGDKISISCKMCLRDTCAVLHHFDGQCW